MKTALTEIDIPYGKLTFLLLDYLSLACAVNVALALNK